MARGTAGGRFGLAAVALTIALTARAAGATLSGTLPQPGVVWVSDDSKPAPLAESQMRNVHKSFEPDLLVITAGSSVRFPNDDPFFHSIYSESGPDPFDIGFYDSGPGKSVMFAQPGIVTVRCHIHGPMHATIVVVDGPWTQTHVPGEKFTLDGVRPGNHSMHVWSPDTGERTSPVRL